MQPVMKAYVTHGRWLSCSNSTIGKLNQWDLGTYEDVNSAHERVLTHILDRIPPRSSPNNPTVAGWIDTWTHLLGKYTQKLASLSLEIATDFFNTLKYYSEYFYTQACILISFQKECFTESPLMLSIPLFLLPMSGYPSFWVGMCLCVCVHVCAHTCPYMC